MPYTEVMRLLSVFFLLGSLTAQPPGDAVAVARAIRASSLDAEECYRVRELNFSKGGARFYLTEGYLVLGKPIAGRRAFAVFTTDVEGGDAEVLVMPPDRSERRSLATYTNAPNLNEHFDAAVLVFTDDTERELRPQLEKKSPEMGVLLAESWSPVARNLAESFETRVALDLLAPNPAGGMFFAAVRGKLLGNFDVIHEPRATESTVIGQTTFRDNRTFFDVWTSFKPRGARPPTRQDASIRDYRIRAELDPALKLKVATSMTVTPAAATRVLPFDISRQMEVTSARINGAPAEIFQRESLRSSLIRNSGNDTVLVVAPQPIEAGRAVEVELKHEGNVVLEAGNRVYYVGSRANWYPSRGTQFAAFDLTFEYPKDLDLVTTGEVVEDRTEGDRRITRRRTEAPVRLAGFNLGVYRRTTLKRGGLVLEMCANEKAERALQHTPAPPTPPVPPPFGRPRRPDMLAIPVEAPSQPNPVSRLEPLAEEIASALEFMAARFGPPPLRTLTVSPVPGAFGQGFPGLIYLSTLSYLAPGDFAFRRLGDRQQLFFREILHAHELAHQWWGNLVTTSSYHDEWLMEALSQYSALMYLEKHKGARALGAALDQYRTDLLAKGDGGEPIEATGPIVLGNRLDSSLTTAAWRVITYEKGSWIIHMLRRRLGDARFQSMLSQILQRHRGRPLSVEQFRAAAAAALPPGSPDPQLEAFFDQWVYGTGIPSLKLNYTIRGKAPAWKVTGTVVQTDVDEDFSTRVPIEIQFGKGQSAIHWVSTSNQPAEFSIAVQRLPVKVVLDPSSSVLAVRK